MSDLLKKPCSCGGNNPNCYMCGGWGYIDSVSESRISSGQGQLAKAKPRKIRALRKSLSDEDLVNILCGNKTIDEIKLAKRKSKKNKAQTNIKT